jgi:hypothetical protein
MLLLLLAADCSGCGGAYAPLYFVSYKILVSFIMLSLIVPVVIDYYRISADTDKSTVSRETLEDFETVRCPIHCVLSPIQARRAPVLAPVASRMPFLGGTSHAVGVHRCAVSGMGAV